MISIGQNTYMYIHVCMYMYMYTSEQLADNMYIVQYAMCIGLVHLDKYIVLYMYYPGHTITCISNLRRNHPSAHSGTPTLYIWPEPLNVPCLENKGWYIVG